MADGVIKYEQLADSTWQACCEGVTVKGTSVPQCRLMMREQLMATGKVAGRDLVEEIVRKGRKQ